jgi:phage tail sheath protein FI
MLIVDPPSGWVNRVQLLAGPAARLGGDLNLTGPKARNAFLYYPRVKMSDPLLGGAEDTFPACGIIAGVLARTDATRGVWVAPAGLDASLGAVTPEVPLTDRENGVLNPLAINCIRRFPVFGTVLWGARTMRGADQLADEYKYLPVRRTALFLEESLYRGTQWVVFQPNDEPLWALIRLNVGAFMNDLFRKGAFQGTKAQDAYFVRCDHSTTTQNDIDRGVVNIVVGFAPLKPAEFVIVQIQQITGPLNT